MMSDLNTHKAGRLFHRAAICKLFLSVAMAGLQDANWDTDYVVGFRNPKMGTEVPLGEWFDNATSFLANLAIMQASDEFAELEMEVRIWPETVNWAWLDDTS
jgi:hypothetical protein